MQKDEAKKIYAALCKMDELDQNVEVPSSEENGQPSYTVGECGWLIEQLQDMVGKYLTADERAEIQNDYETYFDENGLKE